MALGALTVASRRGLRLRSPVMLVLSPLRGLLGLGLLSVLGASCPTPRPKIICDTEESDTRSRSAGVDIRGISIN